MNDNFNLSKSNKIIEEIFADIGSSISSKPYSKTTNNIQITVWPEFVDSKNNAINDLFIWAYHIRIDNKNKESVKLLSRYWKIIDETGLIQEVEGEGVVGEQPTILPNSSYQYSSGVHLSKSSGIMTGSYQMQNSKTKEAFSIEIPTFSLDIPSAQAIIN